MKKVRLFIYLGMLICLVLGGCAKSETEVETSTGSQKTTDIKASIFENHSDQQISFYSDTSCYFNFTLKLDDMGNTFECDFGPFEISAGEKITFTIDELVSDFFSDQAKIERVYILDTPFVYGDSSLAERNFISKDISLMLKYNTDKIILYSHEDCFVDLFLHIREDNFISDAYIRGLHINANETTTFTLKDLAPGFYSDKAIIIDEFSLFREIYVQQ